MYPFSDSSREQPLAPKQLAPTRADLISLQHPDLADKIRVLCQACGGKIVYWYDDQDPPMSSYDCHGGYENGDYKSCNTSVQQGNIETALDAALHRHFYVELEPIAEILHKMCLEEHAGKTAYSYLRPATVEEKWEEAEARLNEIRRKALSR